MRVVLVPGLASALFRHFLTDMVPEIAKDRCFTVRNILRDRYARQFDDAAFDRVHQREITDHPGEEDAFGVTGAAEKKR